MFQRFKQGTLTQFKDCVNLSTDRHQDMEMFLSESDSDTSSESSYGNYLDDMDSMYGGQAQSILSNLERSIGRIDDFLAFEKAFVPGDIICDETDPSGQLGRVVDVDIVVNMETVRGESVNEVNSKKLQKICPFVVGDYVVHGPWLGRVRRVVDHLTILFEDGAKCEVTATNPEEIKPIFPSVIEDSQYQYYPGQHVQIRISSVIKSAKWLWGGWKENRAEGIVCHVEAGMVYVDWIASSVIGCNMKVPVPPCVQESKELTSLSCFTHANWQLGDWCLLPIEDQKTAEAPAPNDHGAGWPIEENMLESRLMQGKKKSNHDEIYTIVKKKTKVDVLWQDGTFSVGLDSQSLLPVNSVGDHEFWPEQFVMEKSSCEDSHLTAGPRSGIVKSVDAKERTVRLKWESPASNHGHDCDGKSNEETVSAYELIEHPDYSYCLGDIVFRLEKCVSTILADGQSNCEDLLVAEKRSGLVEHNTRNSDSRISWKCQNKWYLSCIGNVIGFKDEGIIVKWGTGLSSKVGPWEIVGIDKYEDPVAVPAVQEEDLGDKLSLKVHEHDKQLIRGNDKDVMEYAGNSASGDHNTDIRESPASFIPQAAIGFFKNIAVSLFGCNMSTLLPSSFESSPITNQRPSSISNGTESLYEKEETKCCHLTSVKLPVDDDLQSNMKQQVEESSVGKVATCASTSETPRVFKQFDTVGDLSDHYFVNSGGKGSMLPQVKRSWLKKIQQEWSILQRDLPDTIFVRVCEERIDLLRAAIVGAPGTPYHDGLFFFDFYLPPDYPYEPPTVHYHSGGLRLNPNLYESGKICLSLLNTWMGTGTEAWNPGSSTILQVLHSLQALVLNERPYFNEAGYDTQVGKADGEKNSITYNENAFLLSCKSMLYVISKPPKQFEELVEQHFQSRSLSILLACKAYMGGTPVGCAFAGRNGAQDGQKSCSTGFKIMLGKLFPKLVSGFTDKGVDCSQFLMVNLST